jgi:hypothetical protein
MSGWVLVSKNEVPFFKSSLVTAGATIIFLILFLQYTHWDVIGMLLAPAIAQGVYQTWKLPITVMKELGI